MTSMDWSDRAQAYVDSDAHREGDDLEQLVAWAVGATTALDVATGGGHVARRLREAGLEVVDLRSETLRTEFFDVGAVVYYLRKVIWMVPGFTAEGYEERLRALHAVIERKGSFVAHSTRFLIDARRR